MHPQTNLTPQRVLLLSTPTEHTTSTVQQLLHAATQAHAQAQASPRGSRHHMALASPRVARLRAASPIRTHPSSPSITSRLIGSPAPPSTPIDAAAAQSKLVAAMRTVDSRERERLDTLVARIAKCCDASMKVLQGRSGMYWLCATAEHSVPHRCCGLWIALQLSWRQSWNSAFTCRICSLIARLLSSCMTPLHCTTGDTRQAHSRTHVLFVRLLRMCVQLPDTSCIQCNPT